jgi:hypothetical protein
MLSFFVQTEAVIETSVADHAFISSTTKRSATATPRPYNPSMISGRERSRRRPHGNTIEPVRSGLFFPDRVRGHHRPYIIFFFFMSNIITFVHYLIFIVLHIYE